MPFTSRFVELLDAESHHVSEDDVRLEEILAECERRSSSRASTSSSSLSSSSSSSSSSSKVNIAQPSRKMSTRDKLRRISYFAPK
ncbi:hypothetical protein GTR04_5395 [Trichophyton interdigitale]|uniref:Uncharacterized protein n=1 Tax=Trichophyton interdigitale (strain MR816) TaxID=1215338 RepID=A0A059J6K8_TRIIM|nr:hypothetical protein GY631_5189 [Trichophyton interdigitale]KAG5218178.1 hypothetical protein GY632_5811 [Trichophyton interdigitale]KAG8207216.1 hypothetical protein GTR04_5395 [Trichophyton interdigitale]KDB23511.1 hypothetical protein H109_04581 [Trichophyton interdigitale MR816]